MIMPGPIQDADFNAVGYVALQEVAKAYGLQVAHSESVAVADAERVSREYITSGYEIIAYHGQMAAALVFDFATPYKEIVGKILKGEKGGNYEMRPGSGMELSEMRNVPPDVAAKVRAVFKDVVGGKPLPEIIDKAP